MYLEHINLTVSDLDRSIDFYCRLLDFRVRWRRPADSTDQPAVHIGNDEQYLALFQAGKPASVEQDYEAPGINHFGFVVDDLDKMKRRLGDLNTAIKAEMDYEPGKRLYFLDPDGIEVELVEYESAAVS